MPDFRPYRRHGQLLAARLDRLDESLLSLRGQLHEAVSQTLGQSIGGAIRDLLLVALNPHASPPSYRSFADVPERHSWQDADRPSWADERYDPWREEREPYHGDDADETPPDLPLTAAWPVAVAAGLRAGSWWLRRGYGPYPPLTAVLLGLAVALVARAAGPVAEDALGLAETTAQLSGLARLASNGAQRLAN